MHRLTYKFNGLILCVHKNETFIIDVAKDHRSAADKHAGRNCFSFRWTLCRWCYCF